MPRPTYFDLKFLGSASCSNVRTSIVCGLSHLSPRDIPIIDCDDNDGVVVVANDDHGEVVRKQY